MYHSRGYYTRPGPKTIRMDPDCAICHAPATSACDCEARGLETAIRQAEARMMQGIYNEIRSWVRAHAQDYILEYFRLLSDRRKEAHAAHIDHITARAATYFGARPHPGEMQAAQQALKHGIDEDWQASVQKYPEVLEYYYSLVEFQLPADDEPDVRDPRLSALRGSRDQVHKRRGGGSGGGGGGGGAATVASTLDRDLGGGRRTPPVYGPPRAADRRTPGPAPLGYERRAPFGRPPPPPPGSYYGYPGGYH